MRYRPLGETGWDISEIGFGAWGIGKQLWVGAEDSQSLRALHQAVDSGLNFIDTALAYGDGHSERLIARLLKERQERIYVATKVPPKNWRWPASGTLEEAFPKKHIVECAETSLRNLGLNTLNLLQLHVWNPEWIEETQWHETLEELKHRGKITHFGVSANDHQPDSVLELVQRGLIDTVQVIYNIFEQAPEDWLFPLCLQKGVGVIARVPFDEGALTGLITPQTQFPKKDWRNFYFRGDHKEQVYDRVKKLSQLVDEETQTLPELALKFCLHHPAVSSVIPGMRSLKHVAENLKISEESPLSPYQVRQLREHRWEKNFYQRG